MSSCFVDYYQLKVSSVYSFVVLYFTTIHPVYSISLSICPLWNMDFRQIMILTRTASNMLIMGENLMEIKFLLSRNNTCI